MGTPKALMQVPDGPWWAVQEARLARVGVSAMWVVSERVRSEMVAAQRPMPEVTVADDGAPMFESLIVGLTAVESKNLAGVFVLPVDVPAPKEGVWHTLAQATGQSRDGIVSPSFEGRHGHPVYIPWNF